MFSLLDALSSRKYGGVGASVPMLLDDKLENMHISRCRLWNVRQSQASSKFGLNIGACSYEGFYVRFLDTIHRACERTDGKRSNL